MAFCNWKLVIIPRVYKSREHYDLKWSEVMEKSTLDGKVYLMLEEQSRKDVTEQWLARTQTEIPSQCFRRKLFS